MNSMTGFIFDVIKTEQGIFPASLRSLNHRYLDIYIKLPEELKAIEPDIRQLLQSQFKRGKIEFVLKSQSSNVSLTDFSLNKPLLNKLSTALKTLQETIPCSTIELTRLLNWPGILTEAETSVDGLCQRILKEIQTLAKKLLRIRQQEGLQLKQYIESTLKLIAQQLNVIKKHMHNSIKQQKDKILSQLKQLEVDLDDNRLGQEITLLAQKVDITEEINRLETYLIETNKLLQDKTQTGRRLDFLMQELNREANTICSKSANINVTQAAIEIKVLIEQIREQAQNLE